MEFRGMCTSSVIAAAAIMAAATGCSSGSGGDRTASAPPEKTNIVVDAAPIIDSVGLFIAKMNGLFAAQGLNVTIDNVGTSTAQELQGQLAGKYDVTGGDYVTYIGTEATGQASLRIISEGSILQPNDLTLMVTAKSKVTSLKTLKQKTISVNAPNNVGQLLVDSMLTENGISLSDVQLNTNEPFMAVGQALQSGTIDAGYESEPFVSSDEMEFGDRELADLDQGAMQNFPLQGYVVTTSWAEKYPNTLKAFVKALTQGQELADSSRPLVEKALHEFTGLSAKTAAVIALPNYPLGVDGVRIQRVADEMVQFGILSRRYASLKISKMIG